MKDYFSGKRVTVTGGVGFLGSHIVNRLHKMKVNVFIPRKAQYDFTDPSKCAQWFRDYPSDVVIHCAAFYGGIWINQLYPARIYYENLVMGAHLMEAARLAEVDKFVGIGTACSYPGYLEGELAEDNLWDGIPHETVRNYGLTKKMMAIQGWAYKKQYDFDSIHLILTNLYGPRDTYNPDRSHVVAALIRKWVEAKMNREEQVEVWGTGRPIREFMYVDDAAEAILLAAAFYDDTEPLNVGSGIGTSIRELAETIHEITQFEGEMVWNTEKPDGQMKKILDVSRMKSMLNWEPSTSLREGLRKTIDWYMENKEAADSRY
jgi:GDP-L-fucose synthase